MCIYIEITEEEAQAAIADRRWFCIKYYNIFIDYTSMDIKRMGGFEGFKDKVMSKPSVDGKYYTLKHTE